TFGLDGPTIEGQGRPLSEYPGTAASSISLRIERTELGQFSLRSVTTIDIPLSGDFGGRHFDAVLPFPIYNTLAVGRSPSATAPDNARLNARLRKDPLFTPLVTLRPAAARRVEVAL